MKQTTVYSTKTQHYVQQHVNRAYSVEFKAQIINHMKKGESAAKQSWELCIAPWVTGKEMLLKY